MMHLHFAMHALCIVPHKSPTRTGRNLSGTEAISARSAYNHSISTLKEVATLSVCNIHQTTMTAIRLLRSHLPRQTFLYRGLSTRASRVLSALDLPVDTVIPGVYDGQWKGSGQVVESKCPATGEVIGRIRTVSIRSWFRGTPSDTSYQCDEQLANCR
jgi:hypothetical protein